MNHPSATPSDLPFSAPDFRHDLVTWFQREKKDYPWRRTNDPWAILVSEIMLQQTTVQTIEKRFDAWVAQFPTPQDLAEASEAEILRSWEGLGYYRRVRNLQKAAQALVERHGGLVPNTLSELKALPGIGEYTAAAVSSFAFHLPEALVDANVARIFARLFDDETPIDSPKGVYILRQRAEILMDREHPADYNSALMELGQTYCKKEAQCLLCPVTRHCHTERAAKLPVKLPKNATVHLTEHALLDISDEGILLSKPENQRREGFWRLPLRDEYHPLIQGKEPDYTHKYGITHHKITQKVYKATLSKLNTNESRIPLTDLDQFPLASPDRKFLKKIL